MTTYTVVGVGDSQMDPLFGVVRPSDNWCTNQKLGAKLNARGASVQLRNFGIGGDTTAGVLTRSDVANLYDAPHVAIIQPAVNDPGSSISTANTTINLCAIILAIMYGAYGPGKGITAGVGVSVAGQANLPTGGAPGQRYVVLSDTSTTGGVAATDAAQATTITGSVAADGNGNKITVWEYRYGQSGERGWGRVATLSAGPTKLCNRFVVPAIPYRNFSNTYSTTGDTPSTAYAQNATLRTAQQNAVSVMNHAVSGTPSVIYADFYAFLRARILAGTDPNFSADTSLVATTAYDQTKSWHAADGNQHFSLYGHDLLAQHLDAEIHSQAPAWITEMAAA